MPLAIFAGYGIAIRDIAAIGLAFGCLLALNLWWIHAQNRSSTVFRSICLKIAAADAELREAPSGDRAGAMPAS